MRNLKRFLALTLTMLMVVGCFSFTSSAKQFDDVSDYAEAVDTLSDLGVIWGYEDGNFGPDDAVTRWQMALFIARLETGKTTSSDDELYWKAAENYTDFVDVNADQRIGAINYAADEGIIIGTSATTFEPEAGIMYQDALTMMVRALGYGSSAMDAGYPWKYINKANELGLCDNLTDIAYTDTLTRGETAQILYNALYAVGADNSVYVNDVFNLTTVIITANTSCKMTNIELPLKTGYVAFQALNGDGTIDTMVYYLPATAFGTPEIGDSYKVTTADDFQSLSICIECPSAEFDEADIVSAATDAVKTNPSLTIDGVAYKAVNKYTKLYNNQGNKTGANEILVYSNRATEATTDGYFKTDVSGNVLDINGNIVAYYVPAVTGKQTAPYASLLSTGVYVPFADNAAVIAAGGVWYPVATSYLQITNFYADIVTKNAHATAVAYDDNFDGVYDRIFYKYQSFGVVTKDGNGNLWVGGCNNNTALADYVGQYIRFDFDKITGELNVYEAYPVSTGLVTAINGGTIVIGGTTYTCSVANFDGAGVSGLDNALIGKQVNYVLVDGKVVVLYGADTNAKVIVFDNFTGITTAGYATALVYAQSNIASNITIATIDGYSFQTYLLKATNKSLTNITDALDPGMMFTGTQDALGFYHLYTIDAATYYASTSTVTRCTSKVAAIIDFQNGIAACKTPLYDDLYDVKGALKTFTTFATDSETIYVVFEKDSGKFVTKVGMPFDGAQININAGGYIYITYGSNGKADFIYVFDGTISGTFSTAAWSGSNYDTVIYVSPSTIATETVTNNLGSTGTLLGYTYSYGKALDMITGAFVNVTSGAIYNKKLEAGNFYYVSNGYVEEIVDPFVKGASVQEGLLIYASKYDSVISTKFHYDNDEIYDNNGGSYNITNPDASSCNIEFRSEVLLYSINSSKNVALNADGSTTNSVVAAGQYYSNKLSNYTPVYYYAGSNATSRVILKIDSTIKDLNGDKVTTSVDTLKKFSETNTDGTSTTYYVATMAIDATTYNTFNAVNAKVLAAGWHEPTFTSNSFSNEELMDKWMVLFDDDAPELPFSAKTAMNKTTDKYGIDTTGYQFEIASTTEFATGNVYTIIFTIDGQIYTFDFAVPTGLAYTDITAAN